MFVSPRILVAVIGILTVALIGLGVHHLTTHDGDTSIAFDPASIPDDRDPNVAEATVADIGFLQDMIDHHRQAVLMSNHVLRHGESEQVRNLARNIAASQSYDLGAMAAHLADRGAGPGDPDRDAMRWMGHSVPVEEMPGLVDEDDLLELLNSTGADADRLYLEHMISHHEGGVEMAEWGVTLITDPVIRSLADRMAVAQQEEITDMLTMLGGGQG